MRRVIAFLSVIVTFLLFPVGLYAQCVQSGIVMEYKGKEQKVPLANVEIVVTNAGSTVSNAEGKFDLIFRTANPGDKINVRRIDKPGYEVLNTDIAYNYHITRQNEPIVILMVKTETLRNTRDSYLAKAREQSNQERIIDENGLQTALNKGMISKAEYDSKLQEIINYYEDKMERIDSYIEKIVRLDVTDLSDKEQEIYDLIQEGRFDEAIDQYENLHLVDSYKEQTASLQKLNEARQQIVNTRTNKQSFLDGLKTMIDRQIDLLWEAGGKENVDKIDNILKKMADSNTSDASIQMSYGDDLLAHNNFDEALIYYRRGLVAADNDEVLSAMAQVKIGQALAGKAMMMEALGHLFEGLGRLNVIRDRRETAHPVLYERAQTHDIIATCYLKMNLADESVRYYTYANPQYEILMQEDSVTYVCPYAEMLNNYGKALILAQDSINAEEVLVKAVDLLEKIHETNPNRYSGKLAAAYTNLGNLYRRSERMGLAEETLKKAYNTYEIAIKTHPDAYMGSLADCAQELCMLYLHTNEFEKALSQANMGLQIYESLSEKNPQVYMEGVGRFHSIKGTVYWYGKEYEKTMVENQISVDIYKTLYEQSPEAYKYEYAYCIYYLGISQYYLGMENEAIASYEKAISIDPQPKFIKKLNSIKK